MMSTFIEFFFNCKFKHLTGFPCPFCGLIRSFLCLIHLNLKESFLYNPLGIPIFIISFICFFNAFIEFGYKKNIKLIKQFHPFLAFLKRSLPSKYKELNSKHLFLLLAITLINWIIKIFFISSHYW